MGQPAKILFFNVQQSLKMFCPPVPRSTPGVYNYAQSGPPAGLRGMPYRLLEWVDAQLAAKPGHFSFTLEHNDRTGMARVLAGLLTLQSSDGGEPDEPVACAIAAARECIKTGGAADEFRRLFDACQAPHRRS